MPLVPREFKWSRADDLFDLFLGRRGRYPRRHHEGHIVRRLSKRLEHGTKSLGELERERLLINGCDLPRMRHEELAETILLSPALQRLHTVFRHDRLPVMPSETVAQRERE